jgi:hypothetical protein
VDAGDIWLDGTVSDEDGYDRCYHCRRFRRPLADVVIPDKWYKQHTRIDGAVADQEMTWILGDGASRSLASIVCEGHPGC